jgi:hypothetical protein
MKEKQRTTTTVLWIGGTSSLARTFFVNYHSLQQQQQQQKENQKNQQQNETTAASTTTTWILTGLEQHPPKWLTDCQQSISIQYNSLDLTIQQQVRDFIHHDNVIPNGVTKIVISIRPLLFDKYIYNTDTPDKMVDGLALLLNELASPPTSKLQYILHMSSVAAADHLRTQSDVTEYDVIDPPISEYKAPYDIFKRQCEDVITKVCNDSIRCCHLRLSAIFSDDSKCIQCNALQLQSRIGTYLQLPIDCNSSLNVSRAILIFVNNNIVSPSSNNIVYYTRPTISLSNNPVPYGYYLQEYRKAYGILNTSIWIPSWIVTSFVTIVHCIARANQKYLSSTIPYVDASDYLLQVASREHSFNMSTFRNILMKHDKSSCFEEESILECFVRRKMYLQAQKQF